MTFTAILLAALAIAGPAPSETISGPATVIDGDTLSIGRVHIRLFGMDAPESDQRCQDAEDRPYNCGLLAADVLTEEIGGAIVICLPVDVDQYKRVVAVCSARQHDLGDAMVRRGYAIDYPFFSGGRYREAEKEAREAKRGLWAGRFIEPRDWRKEHKR